MRVEPCPTIARLKTDPEKRSRARVPMKIGRKESSYSHGRSNKRFRAASEQVRLNDCSSRPQDNDMSIIPYSMHQINNILIKDIIAGEEGGP
jgi:hypothetical protein